MNDKEKIEELRAALKNALSLAAHYQGVFDSPSFADRHGDAERCDKARKLYAEVLAKTQD